MLKAPLQLSRAYRYLGNFYKTETRNLNLQFNNERVTKKVVMDRATQIKAEIYQRFCSANATIEREELLDATYIPTVVLRMNIEDFILYKKCSAKLHMDNRASSALIYRNQKPVFVDSVLDSNSDDSLDAEIAYFLKQSPGQVISLIRAAKKISQHIFFLEFSGLEKYQRSFLGYFDGGKIKFIGMRFDKVQLFENIDRLIEKVFGSKTKYQEILVDRSEKKRAWYKTVEKPKAHNLFDFLNQKISSQTNSPLTVAKLIAYTARQVAMTQSQRQILRYNLKTELAINCDTVITDINYVAYQGLVVERIYKTLTSLQFEMLFKGFYNRTTNTKPNNVFNYSLQKMNILTK